MIVRYQGTKEADKNRALTAGVDYVVINKESGRFRVVDDAGQPQSYPRDDFAIIDDLPYHQVFSSFEHGADSPELQVAYDRLLKRIQTRRPDLELQARPGVVLPIEIIRRERRLVGFGGDASDPRIARASLAYRRLVELGDLVISQIAEMLDSGPPPARVFAACALAELRGDRKPFRRLAGDTDGVIFVRLESGTLVPTSVSECGRRLRRIKPMLWDL